MACPPAIYNCGLTVYGTWSFLLILLSGLPIIWVYPLLDQFLYRASLNDGQCLGVISSSRKAKKISKGLPLGGWSRSKMGIQKLWKSGSLFWGNTHITGLGWRLMFGSMKSSVGVTFSPHGFFMLSHILGVGKTLDVSLENLKQAMEPKWAHFGRRKTLETSERAFEMMQGESFQRIGDLPSSSGWVLKAWTFYSLLQLKSACMYRCSGLSFSSIWSRWSWVSSPRKDSLLVDWLIDWLINCIILP